MVSAQFYVSLKKYKEAYIKGAVTDFYTSYRGHCTKQEMALCSEERFNFHGVDVPK
jgi:hypothetical protein